MKRVILSSAGLVAAALLGVVPASAQTVQPTAATPTPPSHRTYIALTQNTGEVAPKVALNLAGGSYGSPYGYSSYYDGYNGGGFLWKAPTCGFFNLGSFSPAINDKLSSIDNNSPSSIDLYNWTGSWTYLATVTPWQAGNLPASMDNIVDAVGISC